MWDRRRTPSVTRWGKPWGSRVLSCTEHLGSLDCGLHDPHWLDDDAEKLLDGDVEKLGHS